MKTHRSTARGGEQPIVWSSISVGTEVNVLGFAFLLNLPWELWLSASGSGSEAHLLAAGELPLALSLAALAHATIAVLAFWTVAAAARTRGWIRDPRREDAAVFLFSSFVFTLVAESLVFGAITQWTHAQMLPTFATPGLALGSVAQGMIASALVVYIVSRQLRGAGAFSQP